jgi:hypothetical protein
VSQKKKTKKKKVPTSAREIATPRAASGDRVPPDPGPYTTQSILSGVFQTVAAIGWRGLAVLLLFQLPGALATWQAADPLVTLVSTGVTQLIATGAVIELGLQRLERRTPDLMGAIVKGIVRFPFLLLAIIIVQLIVMALALLLVVPALIAFGGYSLYPDNAALGIVLFVVAGLAVIPCAIPAVRRYLAYQLVPPLIIAGEYRVVDVLDISRQRMQGRLGPSFVPALLVFLLSSQVAGLGVANLVSLATPSLAAQGLAFLASAALDLPLVALAVVLYAKLHRDD